MKKISVFIGFTPYHQFFAKNIIECIDEEVWCLFTKGWPRTRKKYKKMGFFWHYGKVLYWMSYLLSLIYFSFLVRKMLREDYDIKVYVPHPSNIFSNFLFFLNQVGSVNIYEDGILNYYDAKADLAKERKLITVLAKFFGITYTKYLGHLAGYDTGRVDGLFVSRPDFCVSKEKVKGLYKVEMDKKFLNLNHKKILFLDQNTNFVLDAEKRRDTALRKMFSIFSPVDFDYYYKGHHDFKSVINGMFEIEQELDKRPAEDIVESLRPEIVISFCSSALINIKMIYPNVLCYHLMAHYVPIEIDKREDVLATLFAMAEVENVDSGTQC